MFERLKKINKNNKVLHHTATDDVYRILHLFTIVNDITIYEIDDIFKKLELYYPCSSFLEKKPVAIADDIWKEEGYIGSIQFDKEIFDDYNSSNKYAKNVYDEADRHVFLNHVLHLCKDHIILELNYKYPGYVMGDMTTTCRRTYFKIDKMEQQFSFIKDKEYVNISGSYGSMVIKNDNCYIREQLSDNIIRLIFIKGDGKKLVIEISKDKEQFIDFVDEKHLINYILHSNFELPSVALKYMVDYFERNNINVSFIKIMNMVNGYKIAKDLVYEDYSEINNSKKISLLEKQVFNGDIDNKKKPTLKTINIYNTYENDKIIRIIEVDAKNTAKLILKVTMNKEVCIPNENQLINYLLKEFPHLSITEYFNFNKTDVLFDKISSISFSNIDDNLYKVELLHYSGDSLIASREWKRYSFEEENPVLKRK